MTQCIHTQEGNTAFVSLNNVAKRNALSPALISDLHKTFRTISQSEDIKVTVIRAEGHMFCAGADLNWMRSGGQMSLNEATIDAQPLADLLKAIYELPCLTIACVQGDAYGGGVGLLACCDLILAAKSVRFCLPELRLGLIPAVISPYLVNRLGASQAMRVAMYAEIFNAHQALQWGLIDTLTPLENLDETLANLLNQFTLNAPSAMRQCKQLFRKFDQIKIDNALVKQTATLIAERRISAEAQTRIDTFFEKQKLK